MKLPYVIKVNVAGINEVKEIAAENERLKTDIGNLLLLLVKKGRGENHDWLVSGSSCKHEVSYISEEIRKLYGRIDELTNELKSKS
jgi:hypothetical protein